MRAPCRYQIAAPQDAFYPTGTPRTRNVSQLHKAMEWAAVFYRLQSPFQELHCRVTVTAHNCPEDFRVVGWFDETGWHWSPTGGTHGRRLHKV